MGKNSIEMNAENLNEWLAPLGYLFPKNSWELKQFEILHGSYDYKLNDKSIDVDAIIEGRFQSKAIVQIPLLEEEENTIQELRMAARKGEAVPEEILEKMKRNQEKKRNGE
jgi:hypothetical protein